MAIWDRIRGAKQAADEHQQRTSEQAQQRAVTAEQPYRHVPTHARQDAMHAVPGATMEETRRKIREQHQRRLTLGLNGDVSRSSSRDPGSHQRRLSAVSSVYSSDEAGPSGIANTVARSHASVASSASASSGKGIVDKALHEPVLGFLSGQPATDFATDASGIVSPGFQRSAFDRGHSHQALDRDAAPAVDSLPASTNRLHDNSGHSKGEPSCQVQGNDAGMEERPKKSLRQEELYQMLTKKE